jgi:WD40 repeat protein
MLMRAQIRVPGRANDVALAPHRPIIAVGTGRRKIVLWDYQRAERESVLGELGHSIGNVAFTADGTLLCAERTNRTTTPCGIFGWDDAGQQFRLGQHVGSVTAVEPVGTAQAISAGRDGQVVLWDVAEKRELRRQRLYRQISAHRRNDWARSAVVSPDEGQVILLGSRLEMMILPQMNNMMLWSSPRTARSAAFSPDSESLVVGHRRGEVIAWRLEEDTAEWLDRTVNPWQMRIEECQSLVQIKQITRHGARVEKVGILPSWSILVSAAIDGSIHFTSLQDQRLLAQVVVPSGRITSLHLSPDESLMAVGHSEETFSLWDLRGLQTYVVLGRPLGLAQASALPAIDAVAGFSDLPIEARLAIQYVEAILQYRFRYDIELGAAPTIMAGEFDIEID